MVYIGVDLGGTNIVAGLVSESGRIIRKDSTPTLSDRGQDEVIKDIVKLCRKVLADGQADTTDLRGVGVGSPGACDSKNGVIEHNCNLGFRNARVCEAIEQALFVPAYLDNDGNCAALGESAGGAAKGYDHSVTITLGTGIGGGIICGGKLLKGAFGSAGEVGHHVIEQGGEPCNCGKAGCWEAYASATALIKAAKTAAARNPNSALLTVVNNDFGAITGRTVFQAAHQGDDTARGVIDRYLRYVACGLTNIINILQPEVVVIGGGISGQGEAILAPIRRYVAEDVFTDTLMTNIAVSALGNDAGVVGAAMLGRI